MESDDAGDIHCAHQIPVCLLPVVFGHNRKLFLSSNHHTTMLKRCCFGSKVITHHSASSFSTLEAIPEAVAVDMHLCSSGEVDSGPGRAAEALPCSLQGSQAGMRGQIQELQHHKEACKSRAESQ